MSETKALFDLCEGPVANELAAGGEPYLRQKLLDACALARHRVAHLEQENARLTSDLIRSEGERERLMRQDRVLPPGKAR